MTKSIQFWLGASFTTRWATQGLLSWLIAWPLSIPAGYLMTQALGIALQNEIIYYYTPTKPLYWLVLVTILSIAASWLPARISVRESLAYQ